MSGTAAPDPGLVLPSSPVIEVGPGLRLRRYASADLDAVVAQSTDPEMRRWTSVPLEYGEVEGRRFLEQAEREWRTGGAARLVVEEGGAFCGGINIRSADEGWCDLGYGLGPWARGRGLMVPAVRRALRWAFEDLGVQGFRWEAAVGNEASRRTALSCGFVMTGTAERSIEQRGAHLDAWIAELSLGAWARGGGRG